MQKSFESQLHNQTNANKIEFPSIRELERSQTAQIQKKLRQQQLQWYGSLLNLYKNKNKQVTILVEEERTYHNANQREFMSKSQISQLDTIVNTPVSQMKKRGTTFTSLQQFLGGNDSFKDQNEGLKLEPIIQGNKNKSAQK
ncbi:Hypothetical_protein [Hexamita inflata]|uniref:Hypothetical_protein n=1 Tax=Hexamita inflata TaxID=28002 RepID=A0AA86TUX2_9EUKA|nr:Hypothetical protein HINF_LOCUS17236 [Hexamita inflata]